MTKTAIIVGASSGLGHDVALLLLQRGWRVGLAARRIEPLQQLCQQWPGQAVALSIDVTSDDGAERLEQLIGKAGGMDLYVHTAGIGYQNMGLEPGKELRTAQTNGVGFIRMVGAAYRHMATHGGGHIAVISSIAGTKGLGAAPAYSATKALQATYIQALEQQAHMRRLPITFTDIRPGFVSTPLLADGHSYPMLLQPGQAARLIVRAIEQKKHVAVIDWRYRLLTAAWRRVPRCLWRKMSIKTKH